jgi:LacI family transcriptional regulator
VAVVGVGNEDFFCETSNPPLSSIDTQAARIGYEAAALLLSLLRGKRAPHAPRLIEPLGVVIRRSSSVCAVEDAHVATVVKYLRDRAGHPISVGDLVRLVPVSRRGLERRFRQCLNRSIREEIHRLKLERIKNLLAMSDQPIGEVADICGFLQITHMSNFFRKKTGKTPGEFRRQFRSRKKVH